MNTDRLKSFIQAAENLQVLLTLARAGYGCSLLFAFTQKSGIDTGKHLYRFSIFPLFYLLKTTNFTHLQALHNCSAQQQEVHHIVPLSIQEHLGSALPLTG